MEERELRAAIEAGMSIGQIAREFGRSKGSVRHWMDKYGLKTQNRSKRDSTAEAISARTTGLTQVVKICPTHGETNFAREGRGYYRCTRCRSEAVSKRRRRVKAILVAEAGGRCVICGYDRYVGALEFHHLDPAQKTRGLSAGGLALALDLLRTEAEKCVLLCSNCHAEVEGGVASVPIH